jgi:hypothetical protein
MQLKSFVIFENMKVATGAAEIKENSDAAASANSRDMLFGLHI